LLKPKTIIYSTNLAGRGTDIRLDEELKNNGGLHVIVAYLPENLRVEEQAFGRAARCGDQGTAQLIVYANEIEHGKNLNISKLKLKRNAKEVRRIQKITDYYQEKLLIEEKCFDQFSTEFKKRKTVFDKLKIDEERKKISFKGFT
jgi:superfamily II DNA/RNA helicase